MCIRLRPTGDANVVKNPSAFLLSHCDGISQSLGSVIDQPLFVSRASRQPLGQPLFKVSSPGTIRLRADLPFNILFKFRKALFEFLTTLDSKLNHVQQPKSLNTYPLLSD